MVRMLSASMTEGCKESQQLEDPKVLQSRLYKCYRSGVAKNITYIEL